MNRTTALALAAVLVAAPCTGALAQAPTAQQTLDMRDDASQWINDPHVHEFYQVTIEAFAHGPDHFDRAAYDKRFREIFTDFAASHHMSREALLNHLKRFPGEMVLMVRRDPQTLASYDNFIVALFGPQRSGPGAGPG